jgi:hypothetical protein
MKPQLPQQSPPNPSASPGHAIGMSNAAAAARIEEDYAGSRPYQHSIEIARNAAQQRGTTSVYIDIVQMPGTGALKRGFFNNGPSMTEDELNRYMTTIGEGTGDLWRLDNTLGNRHAGARSAVLPWTDLMVLSYDGANLPGGLMMKLYKNPANNQYEYTPPATPAPELLALLSDRPEVRAAGHGVAFIYLGRDEAADGPFCDPNPNKGETDNGIADALRDRIFAPVGAEGQPINITVNTPMPTTAGDKGGGRRLVGASGRKYRLDGRVIRGHAEWCSRPVETGRVVVDDALGVTATWALLPATAVADSRHLPYGGKGHVVVRYKNESMVLAAPGGSFPELPRAMRLWGVQLADVYNRLSIVIEGPTDPGPDPDNPRLHLHQDPTRSKMIMSNGADLPIEQWGATFIDRMPKAVADANKAARQGVGPGGKITLSTADRLKARLASRINAFAQSRRRKAGTGILGPSGTAGTDYPDGEITTTVALPEGAPSPTGAPGMTRGGTTTRRSKRKGKKPMRPARVTSTSVSTTKQRTPGSEAATEVRPQQAPVPEPVPMPAVNWKKQGLDEDHFASWHAASGCVYFNLDHPIFRTQFQYFSGEWLSLHANYRRKVLDEDVLHAVHEAYFEDTIARVMSYVGEHGLAKATTDLTDLALTIGAHGFENVQAKIEDRIRAAAGRGVVSSGVAA